MGAPGTKRGVETFAPGVHPGDEPGEVWRYSDRDVRGVLANFRRLSMGPRPLHRVPVVETHDGGPAHGWVTAAYLDERGVLLTDWEHVSPALMHAIDTRRYRKVSAEIRPDFMDRAGRHYGQYLYRVAVLGADVPRVKGLADIPARFADPAPGRRFVRALKFAEARNMADVAANSTEALMAVLKEEGWSEDFLTKLAKDEALFAQFFQEDQGVAADAGAGDGAAPADGTALAAEGDSATMTREELVAALTDLGEDPAALDAMSDDELRARYDELMGAGGAAMSEQAGTQKQAAPAAAQQFADPAAVTRVIDGAVRRGLAQISRAGRQAQQAREREKAEAEARRRDAKCRTFADEMVRAGVWTPADIDESNPRVLCKLQQLLRLDDTQARTFSEGGKEHRTTDLDAAMEEIRRQPARKFGERVPTGTKGDEFQAIHKLAEQMHAAKKAGGSRTLEEKLGMLPPRGVR